MAPICRFRVRPDERDAGGTYIVSMEEPIEFNEVTVVEDESQTLPNTIRAATRRRRCIEARRKGLWGVAGVLPSVLTWTPTSCASCSSCSHWSMDLHRDLPRDVGSYSSFHRPVEGDVIVSEDAPRVRWLRYAIPLGVLISR